MKSQPFKKILNHLAVISELTSAGVRDLPTFIPSKGKAKGKQPRGTGHKHMSYRRKMIKLRR